MFRGFQGFGGLVLLVFVEEECIGLCKGVCIISFF